MPGKKMLTIHSGISVHLGIFRVHWGTIMEYIWRIQYSGGGGGGLSAVNCWCSLHWRGIMMPCGGLS